jgi:lysophospholipase L1-like esterase
MSESSNHSRTGQRPLSRALPSGAQRSYVRFVTVGDSATCGVGDPAHDGSWRGWARILAGAIAEDHDLSFCNLAVSGSTSADVRRVQLPVALEHRPHLAALIVGLNDTMRSSWDPLDVRANLLACAEALSEQGAVLMTVRFHDHGRVLRLPWPLAGVIARRIDALNEIFDEMHRTHGGIRVDLSELPDVYHRAFWSVDRLHPSELGHRVLAVRFAAVLQEQGLRFTPPSLERTGPAAGALDNVRWIFTEVVPWLGRRARDLGPSLAVSAVRNLRVRIVS